MAKNTAVNRSLSNQTEDGFYRCGYPVYKLEAYEQRLKCLWCLLIIKEPYQLTGCGHRVCRGCFESRAARMGDEEKQACPDSTCDISFHKDEFMNDRAFKRDLDVLPVTCFHKDDKKCGWVGPLKNYQEHLDQQHAHYPCNDCHESFTSANALTEHRESQCSGIFQKCPLAPHCTSDLIRKSEFDQHLLSEKHQETIALILAGKINAEESARTTDDEMETNSIDQHVEAQLGERFNELAEKIQHTSDETIELNREFIRVNELNQLANNEFQQMQNMINERNRILASLQEQQQTIQNKLDEIKTQLNENEFISTDATLTWRIDRLAERMADAQSDRQPSIFSPIFYSGVNGYKMRARLYLYGDGSARRTHISLFFLLMKGEFDALLQWPFQYKVTFCLFDQSGAERHVIDSFRPDVKSASFQRPVNQSNIASGIPKFFPLTMLQQEDSVYVRDDTMFIKIMVDLHETPKLVLPYVFQLNPGFPNHVKQHLLNQEKIRKQQQQHAHPSNTTSTITCG